MRAPAAYEIRPYEDGDEPAVLELMDAALGGGPAGASTAEWFRWKHIDNPFGRSYMIVADDGGQLIGLRAFMRWRFRAGDRLVPAVRAVDTATHPAHQGKGIFSKLTTTALEDLARDTAFVFNTPNGKSMPGYLKMGWRVVASLPVHVSPSPVHAARRVIGRRGSPARPAAEILDGDLADAAADARLRTDVCPDYLRWRYADVPVLDYRGVRTEDGVAIFRVRPRGRSREATVAEVFARDAAGARRLLANVRRASGADHLAIICPSGTPPSRALRTSRFVRAPRGLTLTARPLSDAGVDPTVPSSWALGTGDLEVF